MTMDQTSVSEGIGGCTIGADNGGLFGVTPVRSKYIQGITKTTGASGTLFTGGVGYGEVPQSSDNPSGLSGSGGTFVTRRYQIHFALGTFVLQT